MEAANPPPTKRNVAAPRDGKNVIEKPAKKH